MRAIVLALVLFACPLGAQLPGAPKLPKDADPNDWRSYYGAGLKVIVRNPREAAEHFRFASRLSPSSPEPLHGRWVAEWLQRPKLLEEIAQDPRQWDSPEALAVDSLLFAALSLNPFTPRQYSRLVYDAMPGEYGSGSFIKGFLAYTEGRFELATSHLRRALKGDARFDARYYRALSFNAMGQRDSAVAELVELARMTREAQSRRTSSLSNSVALHELGIGLLQMEIGRLDEARAALRRALEADVALAAAHHALGRVAEAEGETEEALGEFRLAAELRPQDAGMQAEYGTALLRARKFAEAVPVFERAIAIEPLYAQALFNLAVTHEQLGEPAKAAPHYAAFLAVAPRVLETQIAHAKERTAR